MGLKKVKELDNGTSGEYWVAETRNEMINKKTIVLMLLFKDKATREAGKGFLIRTSIEPIDGIYLTGKKVYAEIVKSNMSEAVEEVKDHEGNVITEAVEAKELNWFADAEDC